jgi:hypothetical protein
MARRSVKTLAAKMQESGKEVGTNVLDDSDLSDDPIISALQSLRETIDDIQYNDTNHGADKIESAVTANTAKTGISTSQANAITANTAKKGISESQTSAIITNTAKKGITTSQASAITANTAKVGTETDLSITEGMTLKATVTENRGSYKLTFTVVHGRNTAYAHITMTSE